MRLFAQYQKYYDIAILYQAKSEVEEVISLELANTKAKLLLHDIDSVLDTFNMR